MVEQGYTRPLIGVIVRNTGALPLVVNSWSVTYGDGMSFRPVGDLEGPGLPHQLLGGGSQDWWVPAQSIAGLVDAADSIGMGGGALRVRVECGDGTAKISAPLRARRS